MDTTRRNTSIILWALGALVVLGLILFFALRNGSNPNIPNTGVDTAETSSGDNQNNMYLENNSTTSPMMEEAKG
jgi:hypothetical protein